MPKQFIALYAANHIMTPFDANAHEPQIEVELSAPMLEGDVPLPVLISRRFDIPAMPAWNSPGHSVFGAAVIPIALQLAQDPNAPQLAFASAGPGPSGGPWRIGVCPTTAHTATIEISVVFGVIRESVE